ncbi:hypothetical protein EDC01DRAFT_722346 [Geopyxis carbonaria]|nr:hypothetical protein EDC01DRAFT_722346 [Geopyxis carbonaria]
MEIPPTKIPGIPHIPPSQLPTPTPPPQTPTPPTPPPAAPTMLPCTTSAPPTTISAAEVALYDRQIRLWGMEAQTRMRASRILLITLRALANEVAKNLVLAGIGSLCVLDDGVVEEDDLGSQFFVDEGMVGMNRAQAAQPAIQRLNPRVPVTVETRGITELDEAFWKSFDIVIATDLDITSLLTINAATRAAHVPLYAAATHGLYGYIFADLIAHTFVIKRDKSNRPTKLGRETRTRSVLASTLTAEGPKQFEHCTKHEVYVPLADALASILDTSFRPRRRRAVPMVLPGITALWAFQRTHGRLPTTSKTDLPLFTALITTEVERLGLPADMLKAAFVRSFVENAGAELAPVAAVLGGVLAQDAINCLAKMEQPVQNLLVFDGEASACPIYVLAPQEEED